MSAEQLSDLKYAQAVEPETIEMMAGNVDGSYEFATEEENMVHVEMDVILPYDPATGQRRSAPYVQKFWPGEYMKAQERGGHAGYKVRMLHKPAALEAMEAARAKKK